MATLKGFWQFLNTDVKDIPWGELAEKGIEAVSASSDLGEKWEEHKADLNQLEPYFEKVEPFFKVLSDPDAQMVISGLPFVSVGIGLLKLYLNLSKTEPTFESSVVLVSQLAYLQSLEVVLNQLTNKTIANKLQEISIKTLVEKQTIDLDTLELNSNELKNAISRFRESFLAEYFGEILEEELKQRDINKLERKRLIEQVTWGTHRHLHQAVAEAGDSVKPLAEIYRIGGKKEEDRYNSIDTYLENVIQQLPEEQVFDESDPLIAFQDIYVPLHVQPLTQSGDKQQKIAPLSSHDWAQGILESIGARKVMFLEGDAGQGKSVFCRMLADWVRRELTFSYIPIFIRLRYLRAVENNLTETLETCPDLEQVKFVQGHSDWLTDKNTRFLIILDGFDELLLQGRATGGLQQFLQQVVDFQERSHHQCLVTGRPLALQGVEQRITQNKNLERVRLEPMNDSLREHWLDRWQDIFGDAEVTKFRNFLDACPKEIANNLTREPLLIYLLARLHREGQLTSEMFANTEQESQAKLRVYRESVNWVLEKQRQDENLRLSGLDDPDDLREVLREAALCVVQSGNETAQLTMLKERFQNVSNPVAISLKTAQETTGQSEDKALNNLLTTFYLRPGEGDRRGSIEFAHKSFGEYLFAERLKVAFEDWTELDRRKRERLDDRAVHSQIYDLLGFGSLSVEVIEYLFELLNESNEIDRGRLFQRLYNFYERWHEGDFLDQSPTENLPQKKLLQIRSEDIPIGLKQVDIFAGLNVLILLFKLHEADQPERYYELPNKEANSAIWFQPCGEPTTENFDGDRVLDIIHYADSLGVSTFAKAVGPHLSKANLSGANLSGVSLYSANLNNAILYKANLSRANLSNTKLSGAILSGAILDSANFSGADLSSTNLSKSNLSSATLDNANLSSADVSRSNLSRASLSETNLDTTNLDRANLYSANLRSANLFNAILDEATLDSATLSEAILARATFYKATFYNANLYRVILSSATLCRANLDSANLDSANLEYANLDNAILSNTILSNANLGGALLLSTQLHRANNLTSDQLNKIGGPVICNVTLPPDLEFYQDRDRTRLPSILRKRYPETFESLAAAQQFIKEEHQTISNESRKDEV